jgi:hypothetical protein
MADGEQPQKTEKRHIFVPLRVMESTPEGIPSWLGDRDRPGMRWRHIGGVVKVEDVWIVEPGPRWLPQLRGEGQEGFGVGRPTLQETQPELVEFASWVNDVCGLTKDGTGRLLHPELEGYEEAQRKQARRDVKAGRLRLHKERVLPWAAFADGNLPDSWWTHVDFESAIGLWEREGVTRPSASRPDSLTTFVGALRAVGARLAREASETYRAIDPPRELVEPRLAEIEDDPWKWGE